MKTWREHKVGRDINRPKSKRMVGLYTKSLMTFRKNIKQLKERQAKTLRKINTNLKEVNNLIISLSGIQSLSENSIKQIHEKREEAIIRLIKSVSDLTTMNKNLNKMEQKYKKSLK